MNDPRIEIEQKLAAWLRSRLSAHRYRHSVGVMEAVTELALHHGVDPHPLRLAALLHDSMREISDQELVTQAEEWQLPVRPADRQAPVLLHGRLAVELARRELALADPVMVSAVRHHTAGHPRMSLSDKLFFLADTIEQGRSHAGVSELRDLALEDVDRAMLAAIESSERHLKAIGGVLDPETVKLKQLLLERLEREDRLRPGA